MSKKISVISPSDELIILPRSVMPSVKNAGSDELKLLIWLYANKNYDASAAASDLSMSISEVEKAASFWKGAGILSEREQNSPVKPASETRPEYTALEISEAVDGNAEFKALCEEFSSIIDKVLNRPDYQILLRLTDHCGLSAAFICTAAHYCVSCGKKNMRYIEKTVLSLIDEGIDTEEALEEFIARKDRVKDDISALRTMCGMGERELTSRESSLCTKWFEEWRLPFELVRLAYEKTVDGTGKISFGYMNRILENWHADGVTNASEIASGARKTNENSSFDADEFFKAALRKAEEEDI